MADDGGVLGNLPRSRPGRRSDKRESADAKRSRPAGRPSGRAGVATKRSPSRTRRRPDDPPRAPAAGRSRDPVGDVIRGAAKATGTGVRLAEAVAHEVLRRLPRP